MHEMIDEAFCNAFETTLHEEFTSLSLSGHVVIQTQSIPPKPVQNPLRVNLKTAAKSNRAGDNKFGERQ